uniref:Uncharacterized protein n=1 Tax=Setaria digitata TaxID=48799 RepID=A0A915PE30_9BILA
MVPIVQLLHDSGYVKELRDVCKGILLCPSAFPLRDICPLPGDFSDAIYSECTSCSYYTAHICVSPFLYSKHLVNNIEKQISSRFAPCLNKSQQEVEQQSQSTEVIRSRGTVIVAMVECSSRHNWSELAEVASIKWADKLSCYFDALIVIFHQWKLIPVLSVRRNSSTLWYQLQQRSYQVAL